MKKRGIEDLERVVKDSQEYQTEMARLQQGIRERDQALADLVKGKQKILVQFPDSDRLRFAVIADTHIGSTRERIDCLQDFYANAANRGISTIFHCGDVLDGQDMYRGHRYEIHKHGWADQRDYFCEVAPRYDGITTRFITGNHDSAFKKLAGVDVGPELQDRRPDWEFLGEDIATIQMRTAAGHDFRLMLIHPDGGTAYALSYKLQKIIETLPGGNKPNMVCEGHYHKMSALPNYRNVFGVDAGTLQDQTNYMARKGSAANKGGWFFDVWFPGEDALVMHVQCETITYY